MADPSVTYSFSNGEVASAPNVNQNFTDILSAIKSGSTADLGCGSLKINGVPFASAAVSAMQSTSVNSIVVVATCSAGDAIISGTVSAAAGDITDALTVGNMVVGSAASEGSGTLVTEGGVHVYSGLDVDGSIQAGSLYVDGNMVFSRGSFTATLGGVDTPTTTTGFYSIHGDSVTVYLQAVGFKATSNTNYMYFSGLPAAIIDNLSTATVARAFQVACPTVGVRDGVAIASGNIAALIMYDVNNPDWVYFTLDGNSAGWLDSGEKGLNSRFSINIPLTGLMI